MPSLRRRRFLELRCSGKSTYEAYRQAGYKGTRHAAYQLLSDCKEELRQILERRAPEVELRAKESSSLDERVELLKLIQKFVPSRENAGLNGNGGSIILAALLVVGVGASIFIASQLTQTSAQSTELQLHATAQADNIARGGLTDTVTWFRNQAQQPVRSSANPALYPYADAAFYPQLSAGDTLDQSTGLVKQYAISSSNSLWARYEVKRQQDPSTNPYDAHAVHDITNQRIQGHIAGEGLAWYIESVGYVYRNVNPSLPYNQSPNEVVAHSRVAMEIRRIALTLPANAAVIVNNLNNVTLTSNGRIIGPTSYAGVAYYSGSAASVSGTGAYIQGTPSTYHVSTGTLIDFQSVFGLLPNDLKMMADYDINNLTPMPTAYPSMAIMYIEKNVTFDNASGTIPLIGGGILYVNGNLTINSGSNTVFSGVIYVTGNVVINGPADISGCLLAAGSVTLNGSGDVAQITYDNSMINSVRNQVGLYRENKSTLYKFSATQ